MSNDKYIVLKNPKILCFRKPIPQCSQIGNIDDIMDINSIKSYTYVLVRSGSVKVALGDGTYDDKNYYEYKLKEE